MINGEMIQEVILTKEDFNKLEEELTCLKTVKRHEIAERIKIAISFGDLSENSEYEDAKNEQAFIEGKISMLEKKLSNVQIIDKAKVDTNTVSVGARIKILDLEYNEEMELTMAGSEANPQEHKISNVSPLGKALLGHAVGEIVEVAAPAGIIKYKILAIRK